MRVDKIEDLSLSFHRCINHTHKHKKRRRWLPQIHIAVLSRSISPDLAAAIYKAN